MDKVLFEHFPLSAEIQRAVIASVTYDMGAPIVKEKDPVSLWILLGAFLAACVLEINVIYIVIVCGLLGAVRTLLSKRRAGK